jgi:hypothetical protein
MKKFSKVLVFSVLAVFLMVGSSWALPINWVVSPYDNGQTTLAPISTILINFSYNTLPSPAGPQPLGIYGAGFVAGPGSYTNGVWFDTDLWTYDSYSDPNNAGSTGWWDAFVVNINQTDYYWNLMDPTTDGSGTGYTDPIVDSGYDGGTPTFDNSVLPGATWVWGGTDYGSTGVPNGIEMFYTGPNWIFLGLPSYDPTKPVYFSFVLDTKTHPDNDLNWTSGGKFQVSPVPEPATMLLFGTGLIGLAGLGRKKFFKKG